MATIEMVPMIFLFLFLVCYALGFFGIVHTGIMNSISARAYAFETFQGRANLVYFRGPESSFNYHYGNTGNRTHGVMSERKTDSNSAAANMDRFLASERPLRVGMPYQSDPEHRSADVHNNKVPDLDPTKRNQSVSVSPAWVMVQYGICLNVACGDR